MDFLPLTLQKLQHQMAAARSPEAAWPIIHEYFSFFSIQSVHKELWLLTGATLPNGSVPAYDSATERNNLVFFFEFTKLLMEAVHMLHTSKRQD